MKKIIVFLALVVLFSCNQEEKERRKAEENRELKLEEIKSKYGIKYSLNDLFFRFSYQFNPVIEEGKQLIDEYLINDIYIKGGKTFVSIDVYNHYLDLLIEDENTLQELLNNEKSNDDENEVLIIQLEKIRKIPFIVEASEEYYGDEIEFTMEVSRSPYTFIGTGKILNLIRL